MIFGDVPIDQSEGAYLVHAVRQPPVTLAKGHHLTAADIDSLRQLGIETVTTVRLEMGDVHEDEAARRLAAAIAGPSLKAGNATTGRVNLFATAPGLFLVDRSRLDRMNQFDESITVATLPAFEPVEPGQMVATIKIIPFAAPERHVAECEGLAAENEAEPVIRVAAYQERRVSLIQTELPGTSRKMLDKTVSVTRQRLTSIGAILVDEQRCPHETATLAEQIRRQATEGGDIILIAGASAITDRRDVLPMAVERAGGVVEHFGMPVDPGNLLLLGKIGSKPVLGLPGCARSPKLNGFDWVMGRICANVPVTRQDIMSMGVGGLLSEIPTRPQPRAGNSAPETPLQVYESGDAAMVSGDAQGDSVISSGTGSRRPSPPIVDAVVLAAGRSTRMGVVNKLLCRVDRQPLIVKVVDSLKNSNRIRTIHVVTGYERDRLMTVLDGYDVTFLDNPDYADGLSSSVKVAARALGAGGADGMLLVLGDMPDIAPEVVAALVENFDPAGGPSIVVPTYGGKRGHPVLWDTRFLPEFAALTGDVGAKPVMARNEDAVKDVETTCQGTLNDIDTPDALTARGGQLPLSSQPPGAQAS